MFCLLSIARRCLINISLHSERMNRGLYTGPSVARASHVGRKTIRRFQIEQSRQEGALAGRSKKSILQLKSWKTYSHKRIPKKR